MVDAETLAKLKSLYQALSERPLSPGDPAYAELFTEGSLTEPSIVALMAGRIEFAGSHTAQLLAGQGGTGKTTLLRALKQRLEQNRSYKVVICDMEGYLPMTDPVDVVDFLLVANGALSEALAAPELLGKDPARESYWSRFARWVNKTDSAEDKPDLRGLRNEMRKFMQDCLSALRQRHGEDTQLVVIFDGIEHVRGVTSNADAVADSIERLFWGHADDLRMPLVHVVFTVPLWLNLRFPISTRFKDGYHQLPCVKVRNQPESHGLLGEPNPAGIATLRKLIQRRDEAEWLDWLLGSPEAFDELALASGGHLSDLFFMLRIVLIDALVVGVPVPEHQRRRAIEELGGSYHLDLPPQDAAWLRYIEENGILDSKVPVHRIGAYLLFYRNGNGWYGIRPVVRDEVLRRAESYTSKKEAVPAVRLAGIELEQIRCFQNARLDFEQEGETTDWILLLGDNAHGKSTLLRAIAIGLCGESEAAALLEATPGPMLRYGQKLGRITLTLIDTDGQCHRSVTEISQDAEGEPERLRRVDPELSADRVFVCAYGANRTRTADLSHSGYARHDAVRSLFDDEISLQNPELVLRRQDRPSQQRIERKLLEILMLDPKRADIQYSSMHGLKILGPWTSGDWVFASLPTLSDGYRSTTQWIVDLIGWLVYAGRFARDEDITGVVLVDELEQHLHPRWQRYIIERLHAQFPRLQFIASTHTPLVALGLADQERGLLVQLSKDNKQRIQAEIVDPREFKGMRADQILTSQRGFALPTTRSPESADDIARYSELASKQRSAAEQHVFDQLGLHLEKTLLSGETAYQRRVEAAIRDTLAKLADETAKRHDATEEYELRRQLAELFAKESPV